MVARGLLANPAMFAGYEETPLKCLWDWVDIALELGTPYTCFHQHLMYMMEKITSKQEKKVFNALSSTSAVLDYLTDHYGIWLDFLNYFNMYFNEIVFLTFLNKTFYFTTKSMTHSICKLTWSMFLVKISAEKWQQMQTSVKRNKKFCTELHSGLRLKVQIGKSNWYFLIHELHTSSFLF